MMPSGWRRCCGCGILPEGYIYPKEDRPIRDLLRKRSHLVKLRTSLIISLQNIICRNNGFRLKTNDVKALNTDRVAPFLEQNEDLALAGKISKESIDFLTRQIKAIESVIEERMELREPYKNLLTLQGVGKTLGLTIMLETGPISRFAQVGNYCSYCRKVSTKWISNDKKERQREQEKRQQIPGVGLFRSCRDRPALLSGGPGILQRKMQKTNAMIAHQALAHKLARAAYYIMRDGVILYAGEDYLDS